MTNEVYFLIGFLLGAFIVAIISAALMALISDAMSKAFNIILANRPQARKKIRKKTSYLGIKY
jgi:hypothetical protein